MGQSTVGDFLGPPTSTGWPALIPIMAIRGRLHEPFEVLEDAAAHLRAERGHRHPGTLRPARPVTSCPAAMSSGMMHEPEWPVPPVMKTRCFCSL